MRRTLGAFALVLALASAQDARANGAMLCALAYSAHQQGLYESAIDSYGLCLEEGDLSAVESAVAHFRRASAWRALGDTDAAIADYGLAIAQESNFALAFNNRGELLLAIGEFDQGMADIEQATRLDPTLLVAWQNLGYQNWRAGNLEAAIDASDTALLLDPGDPQRYLNAALPRLDGRVELEDALALADAGLQIAPGMGPLHDVRGHLLALLGRPDDAMAAFMTAMELSGSQIVGTYETSLAWQGYFDGEPDGQIDDSFLAALEACIAEACDLWAE